LIKLEIKVIIYCQYLGYWDSLENSVLLITKALLKNMNDSQSNFEENWEFAITEAIVNLEDKINTQKQIIQSKLYSLDEFMDRQNDHFFEVQKNMTHKLNHVPLQQSNDQFMSKSFDYGSKRTGIKKNVQFKDSNYEEDKDDITLWRSINSDISDKVPTRQVKSRSKIQYEKYMKPSKSDRSKSEPKRVSFDENNLENFNFNEMIKNQHWDEMNQLLDLDHQDEVAPKTLMPTLQEQESCESSVSDTIVAEAPQMITPTYFVQEERETAKYLLKKIDELEAQVQSCKDQLEDKNIQIREFGLKSDDLSNLHQIQIEGKEQIIHDWKQKFDKKENEFKSCKKELEKAIKL
jgi:hypothetical protein